MIHRSTTPGVYLALLATLLQCCILSVCGANYDEAKVPKYTLPSLLKASDGSRIQTVSEWNSIRRPEILTLFQDQVYGRAPSAPSSVTFRVDKIIEKSLQGKATMKEVTLLLGDRGKETPVTLLLFIPNSPADGLFPAFLGLNFNGNHTVHPSQAITPPSSWVRNSNNLGITNHRTTEAARGTSASRWAIDKIIDRGYALVTAYYGDIDPDFDDGFENGIHGALQPKGSKPAPDEWGSIAAWAWGLSRALDYLTIDSRIDHNRVAVIGHSRLGKTSLWAGASDPRFALVISNNSGCGGAALSRREFGETVARINQSFPHWFCDNFQRYNNSVASLPVDQHMLLALCAPRPLYVASATADRWADPNGEFLAAKHAGPAYQLFGYTGIRENQQPAPDHPIGDRVGYHLRTGKHNVTDYDWEQYLNFADRHLR